MSTQPPGIEGATAAQDAARDWQAVHADPSIQYTPVNLKLEPQQPPGWLKTLGEFLQSVFEPIGRALGLSWPIMQWVLIALVAGLLLYAVWRLIEPTFDAWRRKDKADEAEAGWVPEQAEALALLEDADRLAGEGRYDEATHLLLMRSVQHISAAQPGWVYKHSTAREIARLPGLSDGARGTFRLIAERVERSLFALRALGADDWNAARQAYASFALERIAA